MLRSYSLSDLSVCLSVCVRFVARLQRAAEERRRKAQKQEEEGEEALEATDAPSEL